MQTGTGPRRLAMPVKVRVLFFLFAIPLTVAITSCHPAGQDFQECLALAHQTPAVRAPDANGAEPVTTCMAARGWRPMRPHAEPGPAGWARTS